MITFKKIIEILNFDIPCEFYTVDEQTIRNHILWLDVLSKEDRVYFESLCEDEKREYVTDSAKIYIPKMSIYRYKNMDKKGGGYDFSYTTNHIKGICTASIEDECLAVALYIILHEVGHWNDLKSKKFNVWEYAIKESKEDEKVFYEKRELEMSSLKYDEETIRKKAFEYLSKYNNTPIEYRANKYADEHFEEWYRVVQSKNFK